ncbi:MAG: hypothetical protein NTW32_08055 [Chloroflexi bacterium]|nr:hypothetical protein [Chloroflexota bacterium]
MNRTVSIVITVITVLCCACPGFGLCIAGIMGMAGVPFTTTLGDQSSTAPISTPLALGLICGSLIMILIPVAVGFFTLRKKPEAAPQNFGGPIPPAS